MLHVSTSAKQRTRTPSGRVQQAARYPHHSLSRAWRQAQGYGTRGGQYASARSQECQYQYHEAHGL